MASTLCYPVADARTDSLLVAAIARLLREASIEINAADVHALVPSRELLAPATRHYVSHLPRQTWAATIATCRAVSQAGFVAIPHLPVRRLQSAAELDDILARLVGEAGVHEVFLMAGDYPHATGPFVATTDVLSRGYLEKHGCKAVTLAGHPEGHPSVAHECIRRAEIDKTCDAARRGLGATVLAQFLFDAQPFLTWARELRNDGVGARLVCGISGPANVATLWRLAVRCGVGPSLRKLGAYPTALPRLLREHDPRPIIRALASAQLAQPDSVSGIHCFVFGGYLRTARWLTALQRAPLSLTHDSSITA